MQFMRDVYNYGMADFKAFIHCKPLPALFILAVIIIDGWYIHKMNFWNEAVRQHPINMKTVFIISGCVLLGFSILLYADGWIKRLIARHNAKHQSHSYASRRL